MGPIYDAPNKPSKLKVSLWESEEHTSELQSHHDLVCRLLLEKKSADICRLLQQPRGVVLLERELLDVPIDQRHDVGQLRPGLHGDDQFVRLVGNHELERTSVE